MRKKRNYSHHTKFRIGTILIRVAVLVILVPVMAILLFRWLPLPSSAFMIRQRLSGVTVDYSWVSLERISPHAALAVIASEDQNFFNHWGLDFKAIADAMEDNQYRKKPRGASTISQQVAKNLFLWPDANYLRKGLEVYFTGLLELIWSKERILEVYLNIAEMGPGIFGQEAAARRFFHKPATRLNRREAAILAAVLPNPKRMSATSPSEYVARRSLQIMNQMDSLGGVNFLSRNLN